MQKALIVRNNRIQKVVVAQDVSTLPLSAGETLHIVTDGKFIKGEFYGIEEISQDVKRMKWEIYFIGASAGNLTMRFQPTVNWGEVRIGSYVRLREIIAS